MGKFEVRSSKLERGRDEKDERDISGGRPFEIVPGHRPCKGPGGLLLKKETKRTKGAKGGNGMNEKQRYLSVHAAAGLIGCSKDDVRELVKLEILKPISPIGAIRFTAMDIDRYQKRIFRDGSSSFIKDGLKKKIYDLCDKWMPMTFIINATRVPRGIALKIVRDYDKKTRERTDLAAG